MRSLYSTHRNITSPHTGRYFVVGVLGISATLTLHISSLQAEPLQVGRYSVLAPALSQSQHDLLAETRPVELPATVASIGDAIAQLLRGSGYRLADAEQIPIEAQAMLALPLPDSHRRFTGIALHDILQTIAGPAFTLVHDPVHRLISFERCRSPLNPFTLNKETR